MTFPVNTVTHVTVSVKDVNSDPTVSGYTDEFQRNCKILSRASSLAACLNNQQRCYFAHPDNNTIKRLFFPSHAGAFLNGNKTHFENSCVLFFWPWKVHAGFWKNFPPKLQNQRAETLICIVTSMYSLELLH